MNKKNVFYLSIGYLFLLIFSSAGYVTAFGYLPEYVNGTLVQVSGANSVMSVLMALVAVVAAAAYKKVGTKACMIAGGIGMIVFSLMMAFVPSVTFLYVAFAIVGFVQSLAGMTCVADTLVKTYGLESGKYITVGVGATLIAAGASQGVSGFLLDKINMQAVFLYGALIPAVFATVLALFIVIPKTETAPVQTENVQEAAPKKKINVFSNPAVWIFWIATALLAGTLIPVLMYATVYFPQYGMSVAGAAALVSILGFATGGFNLFFSGKVLQKFGIKKYCYFVIACLTVVPIVCILYSIFPQMWMIVLLVLFYAVGCTVTQIHAVASPMIFGLEESTEVMTKAAAFMGAGNIAWPLVYAKVITVFGMNAAYIMSVVTALVSLVLYVLVFIMMKNRVIE